MTISMVPAQGLDRKDRPQPSRRFPCPWLHSLYLLSFSMVSARQRFSLLLLAPARRRFFLATPITPVTRRGLRPSRMWSTGCKRSILALTRTFREPR